MCRSARDHPRVAGARPAARCAVPSYAAHYSATSGAIERGAAPRDETSSTWGRDVVCYDPLEASHPVDTTAHIPTADALAAAPASSIRERVAWTAVRLLQAGVSALPPRFALGIGRRLGDLAYWVVYPKTRVALRQIATALGRSLTPSEQRTVIHRMYREFGQGMIEFLRLPRMVAEGRLEDLVAVDGEEFLRAAYAQGKGVLILTAHYGNFELLATWFAAKGYQANLVTRRLRNGVLDRFWAAQRRRLKIRGIFKEQSVKEVIARLRCNEAMGYVLDQNMGLDQGVFVEFFGRPACTMTAVAVLAKRFGSPVVPVFISRDRRDPTRHRIVFEPPLVFEPSGGDGSATGADELVAHTQQYTSVIERRIRERPDHWIWIHRRWNTRPPADLATSTRDGAGEGGAS